MTILLMNHYLVMITVTYIIKSTMTNLCLNITGLPNWKQYLQQRQQRQLQQQQPLVPHEENQNHKGVKRRGRRRRIKTIKISKGNKKTTALIPTFRTSAISPIFQIVLQLQKNPNPPCTPANLNNHQSLFKETIKRLDLLDTLTKAHFLMTLIFLASQK